MTNTEVLEEKPFSLALRPPKIPHALLWEGNSASAVTNWTLNT
jgi:hypothetical protein